MPDADAFEIVKHRCRCWFCPDCCESMGRRLREKLEPILSTFTAIMMVSFTIDPSLFPSPRAAYFYLRERRCLSRTIQDMRRRGYLHSKRYFYVLEWQKRTEQTHLHVLLDASFVPWATLLDSWSKHRPTTAGPVVGNRPAFGTVIISPPFAGGPQHAARYVTKYLTKVPEHGFPQWVLDLGADTRVRRYNASRGFWGEPSEPAERDATYKPEHVTYRQRIGKCGRSVDVFESRVSCENATGELRVTPHWVGELDVSFADLREKLTDRRRRRFRRGFSVATVADVVAAVETAAGRPVQWKRGGPIKFKDLNSEPPPYEVAAAAAHAWYEQNYDKMIRQFVEKQR